MAANVQTAPPTENSNDPSAGRPYHDKITADLKLLIAKRAMIEKTLVRELEI